jgi:replicative DNA helicase
MEDAERERLVLTIAENESHCRNFGIDKVEHAFDALKTEEKFHNKKDGLYKQKDLGLIFLVHDIDTANKLKSLRYNNDCKKNKGTVPINIRNIRYSISLTINTYECVSMLRSYLHNRYDGIDRTFVLCFPRNETGNVKTIVDEVVALLSELGRRYILMNNKVLNLASEDIEKEFDKFFRIDEIKERIREASIENIVSDNLVPSKCISTGFIELDKKLGYGGLQTGRLYALGGMTSLGKTTFALNIADNIAKLGNDVLIFSLEMSKQELVSKIYSRNMNRLNTDMKNGVSKTATEIMHFDMNRIQTTPWTDESIELLNRAKEMYGRHIKHLMVFECPDDFGVEKIREDLTGFYDLRRMPSVVIVDYLQILASESGRTDKQAVDKNISELKRLSRDFNTAIIVISSFNRSAYESGADFKSFKESGSIEYSCDVVLGLQLKLSEAERKAIKNDKDLDENTRKCVDDKISSSQKVIELCILKNRLYKSRSKVHFAYYSKYDSFEEIKNQPSEAEDIEIASWLLGN